MMKEISEGCRAVIVNSVAGNNGIEVTVGKYIGDDSSFGLLSNKSRWEINVAITSTTGHKHKSIAESMLRRIDEDEGKEELSTWDEMGKLGFPDPNRETIEAE